MAARWFTLLVWAAVAASGVHWGTKLFARPLPVPPQAVLAAASPLPQGDLTKLFGVPPAPVVEVEAPPPPESSRFQLVGVVAPRGAPGPGVALIAVDGKPPRAFRIGATVDGDQVVQAVQQRSVAIGPRGGGAAFELELPPLPEPVNSATPSPLAIPPPRPAAVAPAPGMTGRVPSGLPRAPMPMPAPAVPPVAPAAPQPGALNPFAAALQNAAQNAANAAQNPGNAAPSGLPGTQPGAQPPAPFPPPPNAAPGGLQPMAPAVPFRPPGGGAPTQ